MLRLIFAGTPAFALPVLQALIDSKYNICAVYTQPDRPAGRGRKITSSPIKKLAQQHNLPIEQPKTLKDIIQQKTLQNYHADIMIVAAYGLLLPKPILAAFPLGCINIHASVLPRWRGASPIQHAILAGDHETGITIIQMNEGLDTGDILKKVVCPITDRDTAQTIHDQLAALGAQTLIHTLDDIEHGKTKPTAQDDTHTTYAEKINKQTAKIDWTKSAIDIDRMIRAFNPWPVAFTHIDDTTIRVWEAAPINETLSEIPGTIIKASNKSIDVVTGNGVLRLLKLQWPGGKRLAVSDFFPTKKTLFAQGNHFN